MEKETTLNASKPIAVNDPESEIKKLWDKLTKAGDKAKSKDFARFREIAAQNPAAVPSHWAAMDSMRLQLIRKIAAGGSRACLLAEVDAWKVELRMSEAPPLDKILIENIITQRLRLVFIEFAYNQAVNQNQSQVEYWDNLLTTTQNRLLKAVESLAKIRKLARHTPALQVNIAEAGGQQVNVSGVSFSCP